MSKIEGVKDCVKFLEKKIKEENKILIAYFDYYGVYGDATLRQQERIRALTEVKISLEKYWRKLKQEQIEYN